MVDSSQLNDAAEADLGRWPLRKFRIIAPVASLFSGLLSGAWVESHFGLFAPWVCFGTVLTIAICSSIERPSIGRVIYLFFLSFVAFLSAALGFLLCLGLVQFGNGIAILLVQGSIVGAFGGYVLGYGLYYQSAWFRSKTFLIAVPIAGALLCAIAAVLDINLHDVHRYPRTTSSMFSMTIWQVGISMVISLLAKSPFHRTVAITGDTQNV